MFSLSTVAKLTASYAGNLSKTQFGKRDGMGRLVSENRLRNMQGDPSQTRNNAHPEYTGSGMAGVSRSGAMFSPPPTPGMSPVSGVSVPAMSAPPANQSMASQIINMEQQRLGL